MVDVAKLVINGLRLLLQCARLGVDSHRAQRLDNVLLDELVRHFEHGTELLVLGLDDGNVCATEGKGIQHQVWTAIQTYLHFTLSITSVIFHGKVLLRLDRIFK